MVVPSLIDPKRRVLPSLFVRQKGSGECDCLNQDSSSYQWVFFFSIASSSTIVEVVERLKEGCNLIVSARRTRRQRHYRPK